MVHVPDSGEPVRHLRQPGEVLAEPEAVHRRRDRLERAADLRRGFRLRVERLILAGTAPEKEEDAVDLRSGQRRGARAPREEAGEGEARRACRADLQQSAAGDALSVGILKGLDGEHHLLARQEAGASGPAVHSRYNTDPG